MNFNKYFLSIAVLLVCSTLSVSGQKNGGKVADKLYEDLGYKVAIPEYEKIENMSSQDLERIANSYRLNHETESAEVWYGQLLQVSEDPVHLLHYAQMLQSNGKLKEAKYYYLAYHEMLGGDANDKRGKILANAIDRIAEFRHSGVEIQNVKSLNTEKLDFSPAYYKNGIVFVSSRGLANQPSSGRDKWFDDHFMALFFAEENEDGILGECHPFANSLTTKYHEGPVVFTQSGRKIFFTRNQYNNGKRKNNSDGIMKQNIYTSTWMGEDWSEPVELPINTTEYEEVHPAISPNGTRLFFSSDRIGGYGQMDLYTVTFKGGKWGEPVNLGPEVNTPGNELFPFVHGDGTLYFSSDGWGGLGGLDIFSTYLIQDSVWMKAANIGTPFNSPKDDFGLILNTTGSEGYLSSDRNGGLGKDDIYHFKIGKSLDDQNKMLTTICVFNAETTERLIGAKVMVRELREDGETQELDEDFIMRLVETETPNEYLLKLKRDLQDGTKMHPVYTTDEIGEMAIELDPEKTYQLMVTKNGFIEAEKVIGKDGDRIELWIGDCIPVPMTLNDCMVLEGRTLNEKYKNKVIPKVKVSLINLCSGEELSVTSDHSGNFDVSCLECDCEYLLKGEKINFKSGVATVSTIGRNCKDGGVLTTNLFLTPGDFENILFAGEKIEVGAKIELKNIFYDFDEFYIRKDARPDLDLVVGIMKQYPSMVIELGSHTDARGSDEYNRTLSQNRANAAVNYIITKGIERRRIVATGYGESQPRNGCRDGVDCTEKEHQSNRRTEIKILHHNEDGLKVEYIDNLPDKIDRAFWLKNQ